MSFESGPSPKAHKAIKQFEEEQAQEASTRGAKRERAIDEFAMESINEIREELGKKYDELVTETLFDAGLRTGTREGDKLYQLLVDTKEKLISNIMDDKKEGIIKKVTMEQLPLDQARDMAMEILKQKMNVTPEKRS